MGKKLRQTKNFFEQLENESVQPIYYVYGDETYLLDRAIATLKQHIAPEGLNDFNFSKFGGKDVTSDALISACETLPVMSDRKVVEVRDLQRAGKDVCDAIKNYSEDPSEHTCLLLHAHTDGNTKGLSKSVRKRIDEVGTVAELSELYENEVRKLLPREAQKYGLTLTPQARAYLIQAVGCNLQDLHNALDKIDLYIGRDGDRDDVSADTLQNIIAETRIRDIFDLTEKLGQKKTQKALKFLRNIMESGEPPLKILAMIARHFRIVAKLQAPEVRSVANKQKARRVGVVPFFLDEYLRDANLFSMTQVRQIQNHLTEIDRQLKSTSVGDEVLLERLIFDICQLDDSTSLEPALGS